MAVKFISPAVNIDENQVGDKRCFKGPLNFYSFKSLQ